MTKPFLLMAWGISLIFQTSLALASTPSCDAVINAIQQGFQLVKDTPTQSQQTVAFSRGGNTKVYFSCTLGKPDVAFYWDGSAPDVGFYELVGRVGNLVSQSPVPEVVKLSKQCRQEALKDGSEIATIEQKGLAIECQAFERDGGGTTITVFAE